MKKISSRSQLHRLHIVHTTRILIKWEDFCLHNKGQSQIIRSLGIVLDWEWVLEIFLHYHLINSNYLETMVNRILIKQVLIQNPWELITVLIEDWRPITIWWYMAMETILPVHVLRILFNSSNSSTWVLNLPSPSLTQAALLLKKMVEEAASLHLSTSSKRNKTKKSYNRSWVGVSSLVMREQEVPRIQLMILQIPTSLKIIDSEILSYRMAVE
jgi:hypothetical protein